MFRARSTMSTWGQAFTTLGLIHTVAVRNVRGAHKNAFLGLLSEMTQILMLIVMFYVMFDLLGLRSTKIPGDFVVYLMSGIFLFTTHTGVLGAVSGADGPTAPMMMHGPMNPVISIMGAALAKLYSQALSAGVVLYCYSVLIRPVHIDDLVSAIGMFLLAWGTGAAFGMVIKPAMPWWPGGMKIIVTIFQRLNMLASGKMFVANELPSQMRMLFDWNPLFHVIDQARGYMFLSYTPKYTSLEYPIKVMLACLIIGLLGEFYTRKHASLSWKSR